ncbi:MAG: ribosome assembly factor SBDS [Thermoproteota archaeon]|jgi:ribosome maturation protein SDO1|uniref:Ribosome assembly factor SBDS n=1 Tax=Candidatus Methanodesulfokora washburnensis TaxID=2478471 RepID=A0A3R9QUC5_9CREN|nr:ribosome assembly factor SBDS [Candidatus Methanodesulfokores washburnensis]RSN73587.1 ribosome assembly factor SBDS [Candidatus Methanodesulfokores washburnensis]RZN58206.1 MAG: ribosome assembly factor SBDS [Candidatus Methanodesulfokores washburnensis]TDA39872.1 MAG: ribosome assembly factor SBDS [Candidatus Korarchaeota archaeon]
MTETVLARLEKGGKKFEIVVNADKAYQLLEGKKIPISDVIALEEVFTDFKKGQKASKSDLNSVFGTTDIYKIAEIIIREGEVQITAERRKKLQEEKMNWIASFIQKNYVDPNTNAPHSLQRIISAIKESKAKIDPFKEPERQVKDVVEQIRKYLPLKSSKIKIKVIVPASSWSEVRGFLKGQGDILSEKWSEDGSTVSFHVEIPVGAQMLVTERIGKIGGRVEL